MHGIIHLDRHAIDTLLARWVFGALLPTRLTRGRSNREERRCVIQAVLSISLSPWKLLELLKLNLIPAPHTSSTSAPYGHRRCQSVLLCVG